MVKRAAGLGKSHKKARKLKALEEETLQVEFGEDIDENDEIAQLEALYGQMSTSKFPEKILAGVIHECDRILRNAAGVGEANDKTGTESTTENSKDNTTPSNKVLPPSFYLIYGKSLLDQSVLLSEKDPAQELEFIIAGIERLQDGLDVHPDDVPLKSVLLRATLQRIKSELSLNNEAKVDMSLIHKLLDDVKPQKSLDEGDFTEFWDSVTLYSMLFAPIPQQKEFLQNLLTRLPDPEAPQVQNAIGRLLMMSLDATPLDDLKILDDEKRDLTSDAKSLDEKSIHDTAELAAQHFYTLIDNDNIETMLDFIDACDVASEGKYPLSKDLKEKFEKVVARYEELAGDEDEFEDEEGDEEDDSENGDGDDDDEE